MLRHHDPEFEKTAGMGGGYGGGGLGGAAAGGSGTGGNNAMNPMLGNENPAELYQVSCFVISICI